MAHNVSFAVDICQIELDSESSEDDHVDIQSCLIMEACSSMDGDFESVETAFVEETSQSSFTSHQGREEAGQMRNRWSAATVRVLSSLPSRSVGRSGPAALTKCHRRQDHSQASRTSNAMELELRQPSSEESQRQNLLRSLKSCSAGECAHELRNMPLSLHEKCELRVLTSPELDSDGLSAVKVTRRSLKKTLHSVRQVILSLLIFVHLWQGALKQVSSRFGTGVLSYFHFLRTLMLYNIFLSIIIILFLVLPQVIQGSSQRHDFTGFEILSGTGVLTNSFLFYGYYNYTEECELGKQTGSCMAGGYNIRLAYLLVIAIGLTVTCIMLVYSVSKTLGKNFQIFKSHGTIALKVFASWDYKVSKKTSVQLQSENICIQLKELLCELGCGKQKQNMTSRLNWLVTHCITWAVCLGSTFFFTFAIYYINKEFKWSPGEETKFFQFPFLVCCVNHLLPTVFNMIACLESYDSLTVCIYVSIIRNLLLKVSTFVILCYYWLNDVKPSAEECWETVIGQEIYRFLFMDMGFAVLYTIFGEFLWRWIYQGLLYRKRKPVFDIARNVLDLIYGQTLAWLGVLFTPLLPAIQIVKLFILFYMKRVSLMNNYQAPRKLWRATQMSSVFMLLLWFPSFLGAAACITYTMWRIKPSSTCGPFRTLTTMLFSVREWNKSLEGSRPKLAWLGWAYTHLIDNPLILIITSGFFIVLIYIQTHVMDGQRRIIELLQKQIENEGEDKKFLIAKLQSLSDQQV